MNDLPTNPIGAAWLARAYGVETIGPLPVLSRTGGRRGSSHQADGRLETYTEAMRPAANPAAHLQFHLRHEVVHLEFLARLFAHTGPDFVQAWVMAEPTGQYARRAAFLYEWLSGESLQAPARLGGNYVDAIDADKLVAASPDQAIKVARWRVNDNLPGTRYFCPTVVKTEALRQAAALDVPGLLAALSTEFGDDVLLRAATWMTLRESKASFAIEGEAEQTSRIQRFADVMARRTGVGDPPLSDAALGLVQREILGATTTLEAFGYRQSPVFVGETLRYQEVVHYVAPPANEVPRMLDGLRIFLRRTKGQSPVLRSAVAAFGFVYIHPLADGNGRVHRFLINDILRRDGAIPDPVILPVSAAITEDGAHRRDYDRVLDTISRPLMRVLDEQVAFAPTHTRYPDGVVSNLCFGGDNLARPLWRYPDLGAHVIFLSGIIHHTMTVLMREESRYLRSHGRARQAIKEIVEMPDQQADRVLRAIEQNQGRLSNVLAKEMPVLHQAGIWEALVEAVRDAFADAAPDSPVTRFRPGRLRD